MDNESGESSSEDTSKHTFSGAELFAPDTPAEVAPPKTPEQIQNDAIEAALAGYEPFDPVAQLQLLRSHNPRMTPEQQALEPDQRAEVARSLAASYRTEVDAYKEALVQQYGGISSTLNLLEIRIKARPDSSFEDLWHEVTRNAPQDRLTEDHLASFYQGLKGYTEKHQIVQNYETGKSAAEVFRLTFGFAPTGRVSLNRGPMTLEFKCESQHDFAAARLRKNPGTLTPDELADSSEVAGTALTDIASHPELSGTVILQNDRQVEAGYIMRAREEHHHLGAKNRQVFDLWGLDSLEIHANQGPSWRIDRKSLISSEDRRLRMVEFGNPAHVGFDVMIDRQSHGVKGDAVPAGARYFAHDESNVHVEVNPNSANVAVKSEAGASITIRSRNLVHHTKDEVEKIVIDHERQHQFNTLFAPLETEVTDWQIADEISRQDLTPEAATTELARQHALLGRRQLGIDRRARGEILAHFKDGTLPSTISRNMNGPHYDYADMYAGSIAKLPAQIAQAVQQYPVVQDVDGTPQVLPSPDAARIQAAVEYAVGDGYKHDVARWIDALDRLSTKGYPRDDILGLVFQVPAREWPALSRQMPDRRRPRPQHASPAIAPSP